MHKAINPTMANPAAIIALPHPPKSSHTLIKNYYKNKHTTFLFLIWSSSSIWVRFKWWNCCCCWNGVCFYCRKRCRWNWARRIQNQREFVRHRYNSSSKQRSERQNPNGRTQLPETLIQMFSSAATNVIAMIISKNIT